jgi:hypothetical protein
MRGIESLPVFLLLTEGSKFTSHMTRYDIRCPSASWENESTNDLDRAWLLCMDLSVDYGYAQVLVNGSIIGDYRNGGS